MRLLISIKQKLHLFLMIFLMSSCEKLPSSSPPDYLRVMFQNDPATSFIIGWNKFEGKPDDDIVFYDTVDHGDDIYAYQFQKRPDYTSSYIGFESAYVELNNLEPNTRYFFIIQNSFGKTRRYYVDTLPDFKTRISIISGGDSRNNRQPRQSANKLVAKLKPHFVFFGGDMTNLGTTTEWREWFEDWKLTVDNDGRVTPIVPARGNHEYGNDILKVLFWLPQWNYYSFSVADNLIHAITLNSEMAAGGTQLDWLENDLAANRDANWTIAQYHKPMRPHVESKAEGTDEYRSWAQLFYDEDVDLVFESDSHTVKSTWPIRPSFEDGSYEGFIRDDENGTVYVGEGCWGAPIRSSNDNKPWTKESGKFNQFKWSFYDEDKIEVRTVKVDNADDVDSLTLDNRFDIPSGIDLWETDYGTVLEIR